MKSLNEILNESLKEKKTLNQIVKERFDVELTGDDYFGFCINTCYCIELHSYETKKSLIVYFKFECEDNSNLCLSNGWYKADIEKTGEIWDIETVKAQTIIENL